MGDDLLKRLIGDTKAPDLPAELRPAGFPEPTPTPPPISVSPLSEDEGALLCAKTIADWWKAVGSKRTQSSRDRAGTLQICAVTLGAYENGFEDPLEFLTAMLAYARDRAMTEGLEARRKA